jgi:hypothetical protein
MALCNAIGFMRSKAESSDSFTDPEAALKKAFHLTSAGCDTPDLDVTVKQRGKTPGPCLSNQRAHMGRRNFVLAIRF